MYVKLNWEFKLKKSKVMVLISSSFISYGQVCISDDEISKENLILKFH